jgi:hypothetical protein
MRVKKTSIRRKIPDRTLDADVHEDFLIRHEVEERTMLDTGFMFDTV